MAWIQTRTSRSMDLLRPREEDIVIEDIAYALARINRYTGHARPSISVAQHSVLCSEVAPPEFAFEALMHDAHEAYIGDISSPMKVALVRSGCGNALEIIENGIRSAMAAKWGIRAHLSSEVKMIDLRMLETERRVCMRNPPKLWEIPEVAPYDIEIVSWEPWEATQRFLQRFDQLKG